MSEYEPITGTFNLADKNTDYYVLQKDQSIEQDTPELYGKFKEYTKKSSLEHNDTKHNHDIRHRLVFVTDDSVEKYLDVWIDQSGRNARSDYSYLFKDRYQLFTKKKPVQASAQGDEAPVQEVEDGDDEDGDDEDGDEEERGGGMRSRKRSKRKSYKKRKSTKRKKIKSIKRKRYSIKRR
jgi:hypothetical protein